MVTCQSDPGGRAGWRGSADPDGGRAGRWRLADPAGDRTGRKRVYLILGVRRDGLGPASLLSGRLSVGIRYPVILVLTGPDNG